MYLTDNVFGLVLCGGKSSRMGKDKSELKYYQTNHRNYLYHILNEVCAKTFISCRAEQENIIDPKLNTIPDEGLYPGPLNGILSAHHAYPDQAWLIVAVDLPHITKRTLHSLSESRDAKKAATVYATQKSKLPEPLIGIWEPEGLAMAEKFIQETGKSCPRKFLINQDIKQIYPENDLELFNANFPEDYLEAKSRIANIP